ncbi:MAG TPA: hypothetical protein VK184_05560 [Nostocaceae cyanobacterium]|nr:hypothetical protein [Nostocaceae cyanobacterium]
MKTSHVTSLILLMILGYQNSAMGSTLVNPLDLKVDTMARPMFPKRPEKPVNFTPTVKIKPSNLLLNWLNNIAKANSRSRKLIRLPVVILSDSSYTIGINSAFIGVSEKDLNKDSILLDIKDKMGISLLSRASMMCPKGSKSCAIWLDGYWGSLLMPESSPSSLDSENQGEPKKWPFTVRRVHKLVEESDLGEEVTVFIES